MAGAYRTKDTSGGYDRGIRFLNSDWNSSIFNNHIYTLRWNDSISSTSVKELGIFKVTYLQNGTVAYQLATNLTGTYFYRPTMALACRAILNREKEEREHDGKVI